MVITRLTRNQFAVCAARGFESHRLRQKIHRNLNELRWYFFKFVLKVSMMIRRVRQIGICVTNYDI